MNSTIKSLVLNNILTTPFIQYSFFKQNLNFHLFQSYLTKFSTNFLYSTTQKSKFLFQSSIFENFLISSIYINTLSLIYREDIIGKQLNLGNFSSMAVSEMSFRNCGSQYDGGAIFTIFEGDFICNFTSFHSCYSAIDYSGGGVFVIANTTNFTSSCFTNCSSSRGSSFITRETLTLTSIEKCQFDFCNPLNIYSDSKYIFDIQSYDILID